MSDRPGSPEEPASGRLEHFAAPAEAPRLDVLLSRRLDVSRNQAATLIATGQVRVAGRRERASYRAAEGEEITVTIPPPESREILAERIPLVIRHEDDDVVVIDKPAGMVVHPAPGNWTGTLVNALKGRGEPLAAAGDPAHRALGAAMTQRRISRRYAALCWGHLDQNQVIVDKPVGRDPRNRQRMAVVAAGRAAKTAFVRVARFDAGDLVRAHLYTGRTHQIRVHLASIGHPVAGDDTYGGGGGRRLIALPPKRHFLHAAWLIFTHPASGQEVEIRSPLPDDLRAALIHISDGTIPPDAADPLALLGFFKTEPSA